MNHEQTVGKLYLYTIKTSEGGYVPHCDRTRIGDALPNYRDAVKHCLNHCEATAREKYGKLFLGVELHSTSDIGSSCKKWFRKLFFRAELLNG